MKRILCGSFLLLVSMSSLAGETCAPFDVSKCEKGEVIKTSLDDSLKYCDLDNTVLTGENQVKCLYIGFDRSQKDQQH